ncbi:unnamed protein product [Prunus brigantina]
MHNLNLTYDFVLDNDDEVYYGYKLLNSSNNFRLALTQDGFRLSYIGSDGNQGELKPGQKEDAELPLFDLAAVVCATKNYSNNNKLGEGGFGSVFKQTRRHDQMSKYITEMQYPKNEKQSNQGETSKY